MASFRGTFDYTLDAKNRLTVPARFRAVLSDGVVMAKSTEPCVQLWVPEDYDRFTSTALAPLNPASPDARKLRRFFSANSHDTELDSAGRVMFPSFLLDHASLKKDVVVTGAGDCLEVWDRGAWAAYNDELAAEADEITARLTA
ncbi:MAG TPA: division/cell wall cluster transcriptional repressor MraZ [Solirubrobacteraceae bacterium]|nr:division/cell wall cluster transcriptional repressor MraZ [Solirubrobacteraceae bacterium]